jgi:AcrR family transcriptional regulator
VFSVLCGWLAVAKSDRSAVAVPAPKQSRWEERSTHRVLEGRRDQILERSRQIVEAAYELLEADGLDGLTIRAVLKSTGLSRRAFYERFADKDELVLAVFEEALRFAARRYGEQVRSVANPLERMRLIVTGIALGTSSLDTMDSGYGRRGAAAISREHLRLAESRPDDLQAALSPLIALIAQQLADGMQAGLVRRCDPQRLATLVYNLISTTVHSELLTQRAVQPDRERRVQLAADLWEFCRRAIAT